MVVTESEFLLVDPDKSKIGWGVVHFISFLQVNLLYQLFGLFIVCVCEL